MTTLLGTFPKLGHDWLKHETDRIIGRTAGKLLSGSNLVRTGTPLGKITASGKYVPVDPAATDGSQTAAGLLIDTADATDGDVEVAILIGNAQIVPGQLTWPAAVTTTNQKNAILASLAAKGIVSHQR